MPYLCTAPRIISLSPLSLATDVTDATLGASGLWLGTRTGTGDTATLTKSFFLAAAPGSMDNRYITFLFDFGEGIFCPVNVIIIIFQIVGIFVASLALSSVAFPQAVYPGYMYPFVGASNNLQARGWYQPGMYPYPGWYPANSNSQTGNPNSQNGNPNSQNGNPNLPVWNPNLQGWNPNLQGYPYFQSPQNVNPSVYPGVYRPPYVGWGQPMSPVFYSNSDDKKKQ